MPRAIDLYPHNMRISNPNTTIQFDPRAILAQADEIPELIVEALISLVNAWVSALEGVTGIPISTLLPVGRCEQLARSVAANVGTGETSAAAIELALTIGVELLQAVAGLTPQAIIQMWADVRSVLSAVDMSNPMSILGGLGKSAAIIVQALTGIAAEDAAIVEKWLESLPLVGDLVKAITGATGGLIDIEKFFANLFNVIPIGSISAEQPNLLGYYNFPAGAIGLGGEWTIDPASTRTTDGSGSLRLVCDGKPHAIRSGRDRGDIIKVSYGQTLRAAIAVATDDFVGTGVACVKLQIVPFHEATEAMPFRYEGDPVTVDTYAPLAGQLGWPGHLMTGTEWTVPAGVSGIQLRLLVTADALSGVLRFDDASLKLVGLLAMDQVSGLGDVVEGLISRIQLVVDAVVNAFTGQTTLLHTIEDLALALLNIPFGNVVGVGGPTDIGQSILAVIDNLIGGLVGTPGEGASFADVFNISRLVSSMASLGSLAWEILGIRNNTPIASGFLPNGKSNFPYTDINTTLDCTQAASLIATYRIGESSPLGVVSWLGYGTAGLTAFYVNVWQVDATSGDWTLVHHSPNIVADLTLGATQQWQFYELADPLAVVAGEQYAFELVPVGATHHVRGISTTDTIPDHPHAVIVGAAATRNNTTPTSPPSTIAKASVTRSGNVPWLELAIDTGNSPGYHDPVTIYFTEDGSIPIPAWAGFLDGVICAGGGGARSGGTAGFWGEGGHAGRFAAVTWERGVDFDDSTISVAFTAGAGGTGGIPLFDPLGGDGGDSTLTITGHTLTATGGKGGAALHFGGQMIGDGPGTYTFNGEPYVGGGNQYAYGAPGASPGGGGGGGNWFSFSSGGAGAPGAGWVRFRQGPIEGGGDIPDTTPPTPPTILLDDETFTTITVTATGSVDS